MTKNINLSIGSSYLSDKSTLIASDNGFNINTFKLPKIEPKKDKNIGNNNDNKKLEYDLIKKIGQGTFGKVYLSKIVRNNIETKVAIKKIYNDNNFYNREIKINKILSSDNHPNIVKVLDTYNENNNSITCIVMEYIPKNLRSILTELLNRDLRLKLSHANTYMYQLANALDFIHKKNILHRDLKPDNILINPSNNVLKLADFGSAKQIIPNNVNITYIVSRFYRAPELILDRNLYDSKIDIWSYGCILAEITLGSPLFIGNDNVEMLVEIIKILGSVKYEDIISMRRNIEDSIVFEFPFKIAKEWNNVFKLKYKNKMINVSYGFKYEKLLSSILLWKPCDRLNAEQIMNNDFFEYQETQNKL